MKTVRDVLKAKGGIVFTAEPDDTVYNALTIMAEQNIGALVVREAARVVGIFSERDYARKGILRGHMSKETQVSEIMTSPVMYVTPEHTVDDCMNLMTERRIRHVPVVEDGRLCGIISIGDVVKSRIGELEKDRFELMEYITAR